MLYILTFIHRRFRNLKAAGSDCSSTVGVVFSFLFAACVMLLPLAACSYVFVLSASMNCAMAPNAGPCSTTYVKAIKNSPREECCSGPGGGSLWCFQVDFPFWQ